MYFQTIRTVRDISGDDRGIATCSLRMPIDILKENYGVDETTNLDKNAC